MPIVLSQQQKVYYQLEGERGPFIVLYPPLFSHAESWYRAGYIQPLSEHFRLVIIDPLGQGRSDAPQDPQYYTLESRVEQIMAVMEEMMITRFHFLGLGIGGNVGFQLLKSHLRYITSFSVAGAHPYPLSKDLDDIEQELEVLRNEDFETYLVEKRKKYQLSVESTDESTIHAKTIQYTLEALIQWDGIPEFLSGIRIPGLLFTNINEKFFLEVREAGKSLSQGRYLILPKLEYQDGLLSSQLTVEPYIDFIQKQKRSSRSS